jgi:regulatory protein
MAENLQYKTALTKAMAICSRREQCVRDVQDKLQSWGVQTDLGNKIINVLIKENFINEERYAKAFVREKFRQNRWGRVKITAHLKAKDIPNNIRLTALEEIGNKEYKDVLKNLITLHRKTIKAKNQFDLKGKLLRYGLSKGFESSLLYDLLNDIE